MDDPKKAPPRKAPPPLPPKAPKAPKAAAKPVMIGEATMPIDMSLPLYDIPLGPAATIPFRPAPPAPLGAVPPAPPAAPAASVEPDAGLYATVDFAEGPPELSVTLPFQSSPPTTPASPWAGATPPAAGTPVAPVEALSSQSPLGRQTIGDLLAGGGGVTAAPAGHAAPAGAEAGREVLLLVWVDRKSVPRIVRKPAWQRILDALEDEPLDPEAEDPVLSDEPSAIEDRTQVLDILDRGAPLDLEGVHAALAQAAGKRGKLSPPLELVEGDLTLPFDEVETLKALVSTATPLADGDEALGAALSTAEKFLGTPGVSSAPAVAEALCGRIREALAQEKRGRVAEAVDDQVARALLEQRHYQKRKVLGGPHLRGLLYTAGAAQPLVTYLPAAVAEDLPLMARFRARVLAEVHPAVDEREALAVALSALALGRVVGLAAR